MYVVVRRLLSVISCYFIRSFKFTFLFSAIACIPDTSKTTLIKVMI